MNTDQYQTWDGAYVLGALSPAERSEYERHLAGCEVCATAVAEIAGMPGLLKGVPAEHVLGAPGPGPWSGGVPDLPPLPQTLLPALRRQVRAAERRRIGAIAGAAAAAAAVLTIGAVAVTGGLDQDGGTSAGGSSLHSSSGSAGSLVSSSSPSPSLRMVQVGQSAVSGSLAIDQVRWGTKVSITCSYRASSAKAPAYQYALVVRDRAGDTQQIAAWEAEPGQTAQLSGASWWSRADIAAIEVRTSTGRPILRLTE